MVFTPSGGKYPTVYSPSRAAELAADEPSICESALGLNTSLELNYCGNMVMMRYCGLKPV